MSSLELVVTAVGYLILSGVTVVFLTAGAGIVALALGYMFDFFRSLFHGIVYIFRGICSIFKKPKRRRRQTP